MLYYTLDVAHTGGSIRIPEMPPFVPQPVRYPCERCGNIFDHPADLAQHILAAHPYHRPVLLLRGVEMGVSPGPVILSTKPDDWQVMHVESVRLNGDAIAAGRIGEYLAAEQTGVHQLELVSHGSRVELRLEFAIAMKEHLEGVERAFSMLIEGHLSDVTRVTHFIDACQQWPTAALYLEGVSQYLFGVLAKDQRGDTGLSHAHHKERFNQAIEALRNNDRPLARLITSVINFSFNHFAGAVHSPSPVLNLAAARLAGWAGKPIAVHSAVQSQSTKAFPLDSATEQLTGWLAFSPEAALQELDDIRHASASSAWTPEDRSKAEALLLASLQHQGASDELRRVARNLQHHSLFAPLAAGVLEKLHD